MPTIQLPLMSYEELVSEPIRKQILSLISGKTNYIDSSGAKKADANKISLINEAESTVTINEDDWIDNYLNSNITALNDRYDLMSDETIGLSLKVADVTKELTINVSRRFPTRGDAIWWRNSMLGRLRDGMRTSAHDIHVAPCIPNNVLTVVEECRTRKATRNAESRGFMEYLLAISTTNISIDTNSTRGAVAISFPEVIKNVQFTYPAEAPKPILDNGEYVLEVEIKTIIKIPSALTLQYPNFIGGIQMPKTMVDTTLDVNAPFSDETLDTSGYSLDTLLTFNGGVNPDYKRYCYQLPSFESYTFPFERWQLSPIFQTRVDSELDNPRLVLNINDLFSKEFESLGFKLDPILLDYIIANRDSVCNPSRGVFSIVLLRNYEMMSSQYLYIDDKLNLMAMYDLDPIGNYHLCLVTPIQTAKISLDELPKAKHFPKLINSLIKHTNPSYPVEKLPIVDIVPDEYITPDGGSVPNPPINQPIVFPDIPSHPNHPDNPDNIYHPDNPDYPYKPVVAPKPKPIKEVSEYIYLPVFRDVLAVEGPYGPITANSLIVQTTK